MLADGIAYGRLTNLRRVEVATSCGWSETNLRHEAKELIELLKQKAQHDLAEGFVPSEDSQHGLYSFDDGV